MQRGGQLPSPVFWTTASTSTSAVDASSMPCGSTSRVRQGGPSMNASRLQSRRCGTGQRSSCRSPKSNPSGMVDFRSTGGHPTADACRHSEGRRSPGSRFRAEGRRRWCSSSRPTVARWHPDGFSRCWRRRTGRRPGRPRITSELRGLIQRMATENRLWGAHPRRVAEAWDCRLGTHGVAVSLRPTYVSVADVADISAQPPRSAGLHLAGHVLQHVGRGRRRRRLWCAASLRFDITRSMAMVRLRSLVGCPLAVTATRAFWPRLRRSSRVVEEPLRRNRDLEEHAFDVVLGHGRRVRHHVQPQEIHAEVLGAIQVLV